MGNVKSEQALRDAKNIETLKSKESSERQKQAAFNALFSGHQKQLMSHFMKRLRGDIEQAEDLVIETFQKVYKNINSYNEKYAFSTWVYKIANNSLIDHTRRSQDEVLSIDALSETSSKENNGMEFEIDSGVMTPEEELIQEQKILAIHNSIYGIQNEFIRDIMVCRYIEDLNFEEVAKKLKKKYPDIKNNSTLRVNVTRGIKTLKKEMSI